jgi:hypothetical protein
MSLFDQLPDHIRPRLGELPYAAAGDWRERFRRSTEAAIARMQDELANPEPAPAPAEVTMSTLNRAYRLLRSTEATVRGRGSWRLSRAVWDHCIAEDAADLATGIFDLPATLFGLPVVVDDTLEGSELVLVTPGITVPPSIAQLPEAERAAAERFAADMAAHFGDTSVQAVERCLGMVARVLDAGVDSFDVMAAPDLRTMADGETRELVPHRFQLPAELAPSIRAARRALGPSPIRWDCAELGHLVTWADPVCRCCGMTAADDLAWPEGVDPREAYREAMGQPEPEDPVDWLERNLDEVAAGQDAASIKARLAAIEDALAEAHPGNRPEHNWADSHPDPYGLAAHWPEDRPGPTEAASRRDHDGHIHVAPIPDHAVDGLRRVYAGPADGSTPPVELGHVATVDFSRLQQVQVRCSTCQAEVETVRVERDDPRFPYPDQGLVLGGFPTMTVYPCGHHDGFTWEDPSHATEVDT